MISPDDEALIGRWLHGRSPQTQRSYRADVLAVLAHAGADLAALRLDDLQAFADHLQARGLSAASIARRCAAIRSLLRFGAETGALPADVGRALRAPSVKNTLAERILDEDAIRRLLAAAESKRDKALVLLLYTGGLRIGEAVGLRWRDLQRRDGGGQVTVFGKGSRTRAIRLAGPAWSALMAIRDTTDGDGWVSGSLSPSTPTAGRPGGRRLSALWLPPGRRDRRRQRVVCRLSGVDAGQASGSGVVERCYLVYWQHDRRSAPPRGVIYPDGSIGGVADPQVAQVIQEALDDDQAIVWKNQGLGWTTLQGPATRYDGRSLEWLVLLCAALRARGLYGYAFGWPLPAEVRFPGSRDIRIMSNISAIPCLFTKPKRRRTH